MLSRLLRRYVEHRRRLGASGVRACPQSGGTGAGGDRCRRAGDFAIRAPWDGAVKMASLSVTGTCAGGQCSWRCPCRPCPEGSRRSHTLPHSFVQDCCVAPHQWRRKPTGLGRPSLRRSRRIGSYGNSGPVSDQEPGTAQGLGGRDRITHSTLHGGVLADSEDPQKSAILGCRSTSRCARKALLGMVARRQRILERSYINNLDSRPMALLSTRGRV